MKQQLTDEQVARKRKDKHAKHEAEQKQERKQRKFRDLDQETGDDDEDR